ncbi:hypothetical protein K440DRAFT_642747 [Wilcoxina mikolae CBS 423.85]|nr:hypothetical protein K440DRAFT_642747 [Wilcoxina mikolae CBS 423.85]
MIPSGNDEIDSERSEVATEDFATLRESAGARLEVLGVAKKYTIAIQESLGVPLWVSEVATEYTIAIQESPRAASRLPKEQGSTLRLHSPVPEYSQKVCRGFQDWRIDFADAVVLMSAASATPIPTTSMTIAMTISMLRTPKNIVIVIGQ